MSTTRNNRNNWFGGYKEPIIKQKSRLIDYYVRLFFNRTLTMFEYDNLPQEIPQRELELILQTHAYAVFPKDLIDGKHYVMWGGLGYMPDAYYEPTKAILVNPFLKYNEQLDIKRVYRDGNAVVIYNDSMHMGLANTHELYAQLIAENVLSIRYATINARIPSLVSADNDVTKASADEFFKKIEDGTDYGIIAGTPFFENLKTHEYGKGDATHLKELIEQHQYLKSCWWNDLGINANFNMKREAINESESSMGEDALLPLIDDMLITRERGIKLLNELWGTNITVQLSSAWKKMRDEIKREKQIEESQVVTTDANETGGNENEINRNE